MGVKIDVHRVAVEPDVLQGFPYVVYVVGVAESILAYALYIVVLEEEREAALNLRELFVRIVSSGSCFLPAGGALVGSQGGVRECSLTCCLTGTGTEVPSSSTQERKLTQTR